MSYRLISQRMGAAAVYISHSALCVQRGPQGSICLCPPHHCCTPPPIVPRAAPHVSLQASTLPTPPPPPPPPSPSPSPSPSSVSSAPSSRRHSSAVCPTTAGRWWPLPSPPPCWPLPSHPPPSLAACWPCWRAPRSRRRTVGCHRPRRPALLGGMAGCAVRTLCWWDAVLTCQTGGVAG